MKKVQNPPISLHPKAQVVITGKTLQPEHIAAIEPLVMSGFSVKNWFDQDGRVGHLDSIEPGTTFEKFKQDWEKLAECKFLDLGITLMNGPPGTPVLPLVSYALRNGVLTKELDAHFSHPAPRRFKKLS